MTDSAFYRFRLYVAGSAMTSTQALGNLTALCESRLSGHHAIEVVDVFVDPRRALDDGIFLTPALLKVEPPPVRTIVGNLSRTQEVLAALGLAELWQ